MKPGKNPSVTAQHYDSTVLARQVLWRVCCQSCGTHRFDCRECAGSERGAGPVIRKAGR
jgi:hypothetical protein